MGNLSSLSQYTKRRQLYKPAMMQYLSTADYYSDASITVPANNAVTFVCKLKRPAFADLSARWVFALNAATGYTLAVITHASNHADADKASKIMFVCQNSAGTSIATILSDIDIDDGEEHAIFFSYDATAGTASLIIDGLDADDTGNASRVLTTGTLDTGAGSCFVGTATGSLYKYVDGEIGFMGFRMASLSNYADFFNSNNEPIPQDETTWANSGWGAQPLYWNEHGDMANNKGSEADMVINGRPTVAPTGGAFWNG